MRIQLIIHIKFARGGDIFRIFDQKKTARTITTLILKN